MRLWTATESVAGSTSRCTRTAATRSVFHALGELKAALHCPVRLQRRSVIGGVSRDMRKPWTCLVCLTVAVVIFGALVTWIAFQPPRQPPATSPDGSVTFLGYTNDGSGTRLAKFTVTNLSPFTVARSPKCLICIAAPGAGWMPHSAILLPEFPRSKVLGAGKWEIITVPPPTNQSPWRISLYLSNDARLAWTISTAT